jgi:hypothetical protein
METQPMKKTVALLALLALVGLFYKIGRARSETAVYAAETSKWAKVEIPLKIYHHELHASNAGVAGAEGFWQSTSSSKDKQMAFPIAVKISCTRSDKTCSESEASVVLGVLKADSMEYDVTSWTGDGIVADSSDDGLCGIGHRLSLDFGSNSVTVTDYPKKVTSGETCQGFQDANSYILQGGSLVLEPPATWEPLAKPAGK